jgi:6-phosphofructokinase 2
MNPAVDVACVAPYVRPTHKIRSSEEQLDAGGGGINVARVIDALGGDTLALVMTGGATGTLLETLLTESGVPWQALPIAGRNRISMNVQDRESGLEYRFVPEGPVVRQDEWVSALNVLETIEADWIVASGSLPPGVPDDFYARVAAIAARRGQHFALDTSGAALRAAVSAPIGLLKASLGELTFLAGRTLDDPRARDEEIALLLRAGTIRNVAVSLGADGAVLGGAGGIVHSPAMPVDERGAVGAGDSFLAALVLGFTRGLPDRNALAFATAAGAVAVATYGTARVDRKRVESLYRTWLGTAA